MSTTMLKHLVMVVMLSGAVAYAASFAPVAVAPAGAGGIPGPRVEYYILAGLTVNSVIDNINNIRTDAETRLRNTYGAVTLDHAANAGVYKIVEELCAKFEMPMPTLLYHPSSWVCLASYSNKPSVFVSDGTLNSFTESELKNLLACELATIKQCYDVKGYYLNLIATSVVTGLHLAQIRWLSPQVGAGFWKRTGAFVGTGIGLGTISAGIALWILRKQDFEVDRLAVAVTGEPAVLASALQKLSSVIFTTPRNGLPVQHLPFFQARIERLEAMAKTQAAAVAPAPEV